MRISILSTGDEILRGDVVDSNASWLAKRIFERGHVVSSTRVVPDDLDTIARAIAEGLEENNLLFVGGGLGPTEDDLTAKAAALAIGVDTVRMDDAVRQVKARFEKIGRPMGPTNLKQADLPRSCRILENPAGTAPGFAVTHQGATAVFFPGVPREMKRMFELHADGFLPESSGGHLVTVFKTYGLGESAAQEKLLELHERFPGVHMGFRASFPEVGIRVYAPDEETLAEASDRARKILGNAVFSEREESLPAALGRALLDTGLTISSAESCTGGLIGHEITGVPGSSSYFKGGVIAYDNDVKITALGVDRGLIVDHGAVSREVAEAMAAGAAKVMDTDLALATSGVAGPGGGTEEKPVGTVHVAVFSPFGTRHKLCRFTGYGRDRVKTAATWTAMKMALEALSERT